MGKALIWSGRLFNIFKLKGRGRLEVGGGRYLKMALIRAFMLYGYVNVLHVLNDFNL